jgi:hypothetical protein
LVQATEFRRRNNGSVVAWPGGTTISVAGGSSPGGQEPDKLIDGSTATKWLDWAGSGIRPYLVTIDCGTATEVKGYEWVTGDDETDRDPITWLFQGSTDESEWATLDTQSSPTVTTDRTALVGPFDFESATTGARHLVNNAPLTSLVGRRLV